MSTKQRAAMLLEQIPEYKMYYIIGVLEGAAIPDEELNEETIAAIQEADDIIAGKKKAQGYHSAAEMFAAIDAEGDD